jgi:hypothetical protein
MIHFLYVPHPVLLDAPLHRFLLFSILAAGVACCADFLRSEFHALASLFLVFLYKRECFSWKRMRKETLKIVYSFTILAGTGDLVWVI